MRQPPALALLALALAPLAASAAHDPASALEALHRGNHRFVSGAPAHPRQHAAHRAEQAKGQTPFATILSCSDSRVPVEQVFDQGIGDLFIVRVAGNVAQTNEIGSIEYGTAHLGTPLLLVLGHESCGAVTAVVEGAEVHGSIPKLIAPIREPATAARASHPEAQGAELVKVAVEENVRHSIASILSGSAAVLERVAAGKLHVIGGVYDLATGTVRWLGPHPEQARILAQATPAGSGAH